MKKALKIQRSMAENSQSALNYYMDIVVGRRGLWNLIRYELVMMIAQKRAGALGLVLRKIMYPWILGEVGRNVTFGSNVVLRHPHKIRLGDRVVIDENVLLDAKGESNRGIDLATGCYVGRNTIISCKNGDVSMGENTNVSCNCNIMTTNKVIIGRDNIIAAYCYIIGGGSYHFDHIDGPMCENYDDEGKGGVTLQDDIWMGSHVAVLDGVTIESGCVIASGATVTKDLQAMSINIGAPAKPLRQRKIKDDT